MSMRPRWKTWRTRRLFVDNRTSYKITYHRDTLKLYKLQEGYPAWFFKGTESLMLYSIMLVRQVRHRYSLFTKNHLRGYLTEGQQQKEEWWAVDGELFKREEFSPKLLLEPEPNEAIPTRRRRKERIRHLMQTRLKLRNDYQESYWTAYMRRFQIMRDEWERLVWDPKPEPKPRPRNPVWVKEESEKYVWMDPRREFYKTKNSESRDDHNSRLSRMDGNRACSPSSFDHKLAAEAQWMDHFPNDRHRDTGTSNKYGVTSQSLSRSPTHQTTRSHAYNSRIGTGFVRSAVQNRYDYDKDDESDSDDWDDDNAENKERDDDDYDVEFNWDQPEDESEVESTQDEGGDFEYKYNKQKSSKANNEPKNMKHYEDDLFKDDDDDS